MKALRKAPISVALGVILAGMAAPQMASAFSVNTEYNKLSTKDSGDVLLYPFYSAVDGMQTWFSVTNTSNYESMAVKIRFREQKYSFDVWDTIVFLSPNDHFGFGIVTDGGVAKVMAAPGEDSCSLAPNFTNGDPANVKIPLEKNALLPASDWPAAGFVGHVEVIAMADLTEATYSEPGWTQEVSLAEATKAKTDQTIFENWTGCKILKNAFLADPTRTSYGVERIEDAKEPGNNLIGRYVLTSPGSGIEAGENPIVLRNAMEDFEDGYLVNQANIPCSVMGNCKSNYAWDKTEADHPHLGDLDASNFRAIDRQLQAGSLSGDWSVNPATAISLDWIVSFPNKYVYGNVMDCAAYEGVMPGPNEYCGVSPYNGELGNPWTGSAEPVPMACLPIFPYAYGLDEEQAVITVSPVDGWKLCNEVNVLTFNPVGNAVQPSMIQTEALRTVIPMENMLDVMGWAKVYLGWKEREFNSSTALAPVCPNADDDEVDTNHHCQYKGPAATWGGLFIMRNGASASENNASLVELARGEDD